MRRCILLLCLGLYATLATCQDTNTSDILTADPSWGKEIIKFPIAWAPNLTLEGVEELRFSPHWSDPKNEQFWSLVMAWEVNASKPLSITTMETQLEAYFDGLMKPNHWANTFPRPLVLLTSKTASGTFTGKLKFFDGFHTGKLMTVHIKGEQHFCKRTQKTTIVFRFSPKEFKHAIWDALGAVQRIARLCD